MNKIKEYTRKSVLQIAKDRFSTDDVVIGSTSELIPRYENVTSVTINGDDYFYIVNEDNKALLTSSEFQKYKKPLEQPVPSSVFGILTDDEIDRVEDILQRGI